MIEPQALVRAGASSGLFAALSTEEASPWPPFQVTKMRKVQRAVSFMSLSACILSIILLVTSMFKAVIVSREWHYQYHSDGVNYSGRLISALSSCGWISIRWDYKGDRDFLDRFPGDNQSGAGWRFLAISPTPIQIFNWSVGSRDEVEVHAGKTQHMEFTYLLLPGILVWWNEGVVGMAHSVTVHYGWLVIVFSVYPAIYFWPRSRRKGFPVGTPP
jgi:hypothetical protein